MEIPGSPDWKRRDSDHVFRALAGLSQEHNCQLDRVFQL